MNTCQAFSSTQLLQQSQSLRIFENIEETISYRYIKVRTKLDHSFMQISTGLGDLYGSIQLSYVSLFGFIGPNEDFSLEQRCHHCRQRTANFDLCSTLIGIGHGRVLQRGTPSVTRGIRLQWSSPRTRDTRNYCLAFGSGAVTTCLYVLGLWRLGFEQPTLRTRNERSNPVHHHGGQISYEKACRQ